MSLVYYPNSNNIIVRDTATASVESVAITNVPGIIYQFDNNSNIVGTSSLYFNVTAALAKETSNFAGTANFSSTSNVSVITNRFSGSDVPTTSDSYGMTGQIAYDSDYFYIYDGASWKRSPIYSWGSSSLYDNLLAWWSFDNGANLGEDISENENDMTIITSGLFPTCSGVIGSALTGGFNISYMERPNDFAELSNTSWTMGCWVMYDPSISIVNSILFGQYNSDLGYFIWKFDATHDYIGSSFYNGENNFITSALVGPVPYDGMWHQIVTTYDTGSGYYNWYFDGAWSATGEGASVGQTMNEGTRTGISIGTDWSNYGDLRYWGAIDEIFIYNRLLNDTEIACLYMSGSGMHPTI